jgi:lipoate-protein ligase A
MIFNHILTTFSGTEEYLLTENDKQSIQQLQKEKYATWKWNYGYSPRYQFQQDLLLGEIRLAVHLMVDRGIISEIRLVDRKSNKPLYEIEKQLTGVPHNPELIQRELDSLDLQLVLPGVDRRDLVNGLF